MFIRSAYNYDREVASRVSGVEFDPDEGKTQQQFAEDADINVIVRKFGITGKVPVGFRMPESGDFTAATDYQSALNMVLEAKAKFLEVPADIRRRFNESPQAFMDWLHDSKNRKEATELGFFKEPDVPRDAPVAAAPKV